MNDHQLLCFLTVQRILNFTAAAKELYCTQPALSYQIRSLEKELDLALFERSTTRVALTEAGRAFVPQAEGIYRSILNARTALKGFARRRTLTLRLCHATPTKCSAARQTQPSICPLGRCSRRSSAPPSCTTPFT